MLVTHIKPGAKVVRRAVCGVRVGTTRVDRVMHGRELVWPTLSDTVAKVVLDVPALDGTLEGAYWEHAMAGLDAGAQVFVRAGGREYVLDGDYMQYERAHWDGAGGIVFGDNGPFLEDLQEGDEVEVRLVVPEAQTESFESPRENEGFEHAWVCRWLPDTALVYSHYKGQKKVCSWAHGTVTGAASGLVYVAAPHHIHEGHKRETDVHTVYPAEGFEPDYRDERFLVEMEVGGSSGITACYLRFPAFNVRFKIKVSGVVRHA